MDVFCEEKGDLGYCRLESHIVPPVSGMSIFFDSFDGFAGDVAVGDPPGDATRGRSIVMSIKVGRWRWAGGIWVSERVAGFALHHGYLQRVSGLREAASTTVDRHQQRNRK